MKTSMKKPVSTYQAVLFTDKGKFSMKFTASNDRAAINKILQAENCPPSAIKSLVRFVKRGKQLEAIPVKL